jgi:hypothetical protein
MKYLLMMNGSKQGWEEFMKWSPDDLKGHVGYMIELAGQLKREGVLITAEGLAMPGEAKVVRAGGQDGAPITDGIFPESKEFLAGYWIVEVKSPEEAYKIAARASAAPGKGGTPMNMPIEVRQIMAGPPEEFL